MNTEHIIKKGSRLFFDISNKIEIDNKLLHYVRKNTSLCKVI